MCGRDLAMEALLLIIAVLLAGATLCCGSDGMRTACENSNAVLLVLGVMYLITSRKLNRLLASVCRKPSMAMPPMRAAGVPAPNTTATDRLLYMCLPCLMLLATVAACVELLVRDALRPATTVSPECGFAALIPGLQPNNQTGETEAEHNELLQNVSRQQADVQTAYTWYVLGVCVVIIGCALRRQPVLRWTIAHWTGCDRSASEAAAAERQEAGQEGQEGQVAAQRIEGNMEMDARGHHQHAAGRLDDPQSSPASNKVVLHFPAGEREREHETQEEPPPPAYESVVKEGGEEEGILLRCPLEQRAGEKHARVLLTLLDTAGLMLHVVAEVDVQGECVRDLMTRLWEARTHHAQVREVFEGWERARSGSGASDKFGFVLLLNGRKLRPSQPLAALALQGMTLYVIAEDEENQASRGNEGSQDTQVTLHFRLVGEGGMVPVSITASRSELVQVVMTRLINHATEDPALADILRAWGVDIGGEAASPDKPSPLFFVLGGRKMDPSQPVSAYELATTGSDIHVTPNVDVMAHFF